MKITIIADASFCPDSGAAGYGFWISSERGKLSHGGPLKNIVVNNIAAEMMALLNGLQFACAKNYVQQGDIVLLQTDCMAAIDAFKNKRTRITEEELNLVKYFNKLVSKCNITVNFRHVKGHTNGNEPRLYVNNFCDRLARKGMRKARGFFELNKLKELLA